MNTIKQPPGSYLCAAYCVAIVTGGDINSIMLRAEDRGFLAEENDQKYLEMKGVSSSLGDYGFHFGISSLTPDMWDDFPNSEILALRWDWGNDCLLTVKSDISEFDAMHLVVWDSEQQAVRDPHPGKKELSPLEDYKIIEIHPLTRWVE